MKIYFTGGGTGGHVFPGIAVMQQWCKTMKQEPADIVWIGSKRGMEYSIVSSYGLQFKSIACGKFRRYFSIKNLVDIFKILIGFFQSLFFFITKRPDVIFSKGGYVSVPPCLAAWILRIPFITHESDITPGLATKINARFASLILTSYDITCELLPAKVNTKSVGNPVRQELILGKSAKGKKIVKAPQGKKILLVLGGSLGAQFINEMVKKIAPSLKDVCYIVHQMGEHNYKPCETPHRITFPFFNDEFPHVLACADIILSRAGAGSLWESAVAKKPSILIPLGLDASRGDQLENAAYFEKHQAALVIAQDECSPKVLSAKIKTLLNDNELQRKMKKALGAIANPDCASVIVDEIISFLETRELVRK